jgi:diguanylate cyclase (GGDEF)-like protein
MPESTLEDAVDVAERIRRKIESTVIEHNSEQTFLTASFGVGTIFPKDAEQAEIFIEQVDQLLYAAKECGRNQVKAIS